MKALRAIFLIAGGVFAFLIAAFCFWFVLRDKPSVVTLQNAGTEAVEISVRTTNPSSYSWRGTLNPGEQVSKRATFSDNSFQVDCRDSKGHRHSSHGYVTNGISYSIDLTFSGCENVEYEERRFP
ncbi:MAG TPA: hypothetical protein VGE54_07635 [Brevundimonas sp.]